MELIPLHTRLLKSGDDLGAMLRASREIRPGDILAISSKAIAVTEGSAIDLTKRIPTTEARTWSKQSGRSPEFLEAVLGETQRLRGTVVGFCPGALLTEVRPKGLPTGSILTANAGLDESNVEQGQAVGWPRDPVESLRKTMMSFEGILENKKPETRSQKPIGALITDSCCRPRRLGVTAFALAVCGFDPLRSLKGDSDLFGNPLRITTEAVADQLATAANAVMGNAAGSIPAVIIRDHGISPSDFCGWVPGIEPEEDLFREII